jgi:hypothetical protein
MTIPNLEIRGARAFALAAPTYVDNYVLAANTAQTVTIPDGAYFAFFGANGDFYVNNVTTATVPSANITDGTGNDLNPSVRFFGKGQATFSVIAPASTILSICWYGGGD